MKKQSVRTLSVLFLLVCFLFSGCSLFFNPQEYLQASLDAIYKGKTSEYAEMVGISEYQAEQNYQQNYQSEVETFAKLYQIDPVSDAVKTRICDLYQQLYSQVSYTVGDDITKDGAYMVQLTVNPIELFVDVQPAVESYVKDFNNNAASGVYNEITAEEYMDIYANGLLDVFFANLPSVRYGDEIKLTIQIDHDSKNNTYSISTQSLSDIAEAVIAYPTTVTKRG